MTRVIVSRYNEMVKRSSFFGNIQTVAQYEPLSQIVKINEITEQIFAGGNNPQIIQLLHECMVHELTHFYDHISTIWGQKNLISIYKSTQAFLSRDEKQFYKIAKLISETRRVFFPYYYSTIDKIPSSEVDVVPWLFQYSCGQEYNSKGAIDNKFPIIFCSFNSQESVRRIARVPLSVMALTEVNAIYSEIYLIQQRLSCMNEEEKLIEIQMLDSKFKKLIYNKELTAYTVAAHVIANNLHIPNIFDAYKYASILSRFCLNLPEKYFDSVRVPKDVGKFGENNSTLLKLRDRGYLFFILSFWAPAIETTSDPVDWLKTTLHNCGLPKLSIITKTISEEMEKLQFSIQSGTWSDRFKYLLNTGTDIFNQTPFYKELYSVQGINNAIPVPPVLFGDGYNYSIPGNNFDQNIFALSDYFEIAWDYDTFANGFAGALKIGV